MKSLLIIVFALFSLPLWAQEMVKVQVKFDTLHDGVKEEYYAKKESPEIFEGAYQSYYESGAVKVKGKYQNGKMIGTFVGYYETGEMKILARFVDGKREGTFEEFYPNGKKKLVYECKNDLKQGFIYAYSYEGWLQEKGFFKV